MSRRIARIRRACLAVFPASDFFRHADAPVRAGDRGFRMPFRRFDEKYRHNVEDSSRFASFFVLELILRIPRLCAWLNAVHNTTHHQEISA
ncbi:hypothetical protein [Burkholderia ubonensis]|uniref:hypothetical protein n=1 Tax=Burkholderia ubonensis TaxID=101571 RepID=UPI001160D5FC|nr:hypothetical protein [Burkholderia ubonensis]